MLHSECPLDSFLPWSLAHPGPIYKKKDTKTSSCQLSPSPRGLMLMILLCTLPGVSAQPMTGCQESNLGWLITSCFCIYGFYWIISILMKACQNLCNCVLQHRPTKSVAHCVAWGFCYFMLCAIFVPSALTDDLHLTGCLLWVCTLAVTNCWFWKLAKAKGRMILQCQFVRKRRHKRWRGIFRCRHRSCCPSPIACICVKPCIPDAHVHECSNASDAFPWHHLREELEVPPTQPRRSKMNVLCSKACKSYCNHFQMTRQVMSQDLMVQHPQVPMTRILC